MSQPRRALRLAAPALVVAALAGGAALWPARAAQAPAPRRPSLLVLVVVDQMRAEYLTRYDSLWSGGFKRLLAEGAIYDQAFYPYLNTVTCVGHATLGTTERHYQQATGRRAQQAHADVVAAIAGRAVKKVVVVPGRMVNIVV